MKHSVLPRTGTLPDGSLVTVDVSDMSWPAMVAVNPALGDTVAVMYQTAPGMPFQAWPAGPVTSYTEASLVFPVVTLTFQRTAGSSSLSSYGISQ